jgi:hypothetical protein
MAVASPGVAAGNAFYCQPAAFKSAVLFDRLNPVLRAGWRIAAGSSGKRRDKVLIYFDQDYKKASKYLFKYISN